jgi:hypothetical protein
MPFGFDVAKTPTGWILIESNAGGNSSFLEEEAVSSRALLDYLAKYPEISKSFKGLLEPDMQMAWIKTHIKKLAVKADLQFPGIEFLKDRILDSDIKPLKPPKTVSCDQLLRKAG